MEKKETEIETEIETDRDREKERQKHSGEKKKRGHSTLESWVGAVPKAVRVCQPPE